MQRQKHDCSTSYGREIGMMGGTLWHLVSITDTTPSGSHHRLGDLWNRLSRCNFCMYPNSNEAISVQASVVRSTQPITEGTLAQLQASGHLRISGVRRKPTIRGARLDYSQQKMSFCRLCSRPRYVVTQPGFNLDKCLPLDDCVSWYSSTCGVGT